MRCVGILSDKNFFGIEYHLFEYIPWPIDRKREEKNNRIESNRSRFDLRFGVRVFVCIILSNIHFIDLTKYTMTQVLGRSVCSRFFVRLYWSLKRYTTCPQITVVLNAVHIIRSIHHWSVHSHIRAHQLTWNLNTQSQHGTVCVRVCARVRSCMYERMRAKDSSTWSNEWEKIHGMRQWIAVQLLGDTGFSLSTN